MISKRMRTIIARLIDQGLTDRQICRSWKISRGIVALMRKRKKHLAPMPALPLVQVVEGKRRCPGCGGMVRMPCQLCRIRKASIHGFQEDLTFRQLARQTLLVALMQPPLRRGKGERRRAS